MFCAAGYGVKRRQQWAFFYVIGIFFISMVYILMYPFVSVGSVIIFSRYIMIFVIVPSTILGLLIYSRPYFKKTKDIADASSPEPTFSGKRAALALVTIVLCILICHGAITFITERGKYPRLGIQQLHDQDITGKGVHVAIIDQPLLLNHRV